MYYYFNSIWAWFEIEILFEYVVSDMSSFNFSLFSQVLVLDLTHDTG